MDESEVLYDISIVFGHVELDSRLVPIDGGKLAGESRTRTYDREGYLVKTSPWERSGCVVTLG
jgi:hypothetical protein